MRRLILAALGVFAVAGVASAQQPQYQQPPVPYRAYAPAAVAGTPLQPTTGTTVIQGGVGCTNCGTTAQGVGPTIRGAFQMVSGGDCQYGSGCQNGCGSVKSDLAFHYGSCKNFFSPCGPRCGGGLFGEKCPTLPFAQPFGTGWQCPRQYDSYANH